MSRRSAALAVTVAAMLIAAAMPARAATTPPVATASIYEPTVAPAALAAQGCGAAQAGETGIVVLDFGRPAYIRRIRRYGTLDYGGRVVTNAQIETGLQWFAWGYHHCLKPGAEGWLTVARGTNDSCSNDDPTCCPNGCRDEPPSFLKAGTNWAIWTAALQHHLVARHLTGILRVTAGDDLEPAWNPDYWASAYFALGFAAGAQPYARHGLHLHLLDYGSLDAGVWTLARQHQIAAGWDDLAFPEIYVASQAQEWEGLDVWTAQATDRPLPILGVTSQWAASEPAVCGYTPAEAYQELLTELASDPSTSGQTSIPFATNFACDRSYPTAAGPRSAAVPTAAPAGAAVLDYSGGAGVPVPFAASALRPTSLWLGRVGGLHVAVYAGSQPAGGRGLLVVRATAADGELAWQRRLLAPPDVGPLTLVAVGAGGIRVRAAGWSGVFPLAGR